MDSGDDLLPRRPPPLGQVDLDERACPSCDVLMSPTELRSGEIAYRCPDCGQRAI